MLDVLIIGSGPAGLTAGIYVSRANKRVAIVEGQEKCGQLMKTIHIENYPGFANAIEAPQLMQNMYQQAQNLNVTMIQDTLIDFEKDITNQIFKVQLKKGNIKTKSLIIATGASPILLGIEDPFIGFGVSTCATCDGFFLKNQTVAVIGGGNTALEEALYLSDITKLVYLIHRRNEFRGEKILQNKVLNKPNIKVLTPYIAIKFLGKKTLDSVQIQNIKTQDIYNLSVKGAFIAIGHKPNTDFLKNKIELNAQGYVTTAVKTTIPGLFVAGDVHDFQYRQAITAAGYGCMAALESIKYLDTQLES